MSSRFAAATTTIAALAFAVAAASSAGASAAGAQAIPNPAAPKAAAKRAAAAANAHTEAEQSPSTEQQPAKQQPAKQQPTKQAPPAAPKGAQQPAAAKGGSAAAAAAGRDSAGGRANQSRGSVSVSERGGRGEITLEREVFDYDPSGRRDPFVSLMASGELRPIISDLQLKSIIFDPSGRNSVAVLRDAQTKDQYRVRVGQTLGRMRVTAIRPREVVFTIDEFGFNRQEVLTYSEPTPRKP